MRNSIITKTQFAKIPAANLLSNAEIWSNHEHRRAAWRTTWCSGCRIFWRSFLWIFRFVSLCMMSTSHPRYFWFQADSDAIPQCAITNDFIPQTNCKSLVKNRNHTCWDMSEIKQNIFNSLIFVCNLQLCSSLNRYIIQIIKKVNYSHSARPFFKAIDIYSTDRDLQVIKIFCA